MGYQFNLRNMCLPDCLLQNLTQTGSCKRDAHSNLAGSTATSRTRLGFGLSLWPDRGDLMGSTGLGRVLCKPPPKSPSTTPITSAGGSHPRYGRAFPPPLLAPGNSMAPHPLDFRRTPAFHFLLLREGVICHVDNYRR